MDKLDTEKLLRIYVVISSAFIVLLLIGVIYLGVQLSQVKTYVAQTDCDAATVTDGNGNVMSYPKTVHGIKCDDSWAK